MEDLKGKAKARPNFDWNQVYLGAPEPSTTFRDLESSTTPGDPAFNSFRTRLGRYLTQLLRRPENWPESFELSESEYPHFTAQFNEYDTVCFLVTSLWVAEWLMSELKLTECRLFKVGYESIVSGRLETDYLRCNPYFFKKAPRYDAIIYNDAGNPAFGRLLFMFICQVRGHNIPIALIHPLSKSVGPIRVRDLDFGLCRLREPAREDSRFIPLRSVFRGALLFKEAGRNSSKCVAIDTVDTDMFARLRLLFLHRYR